MNITEAEVRELRKLYMPQPAMPRPRVPDETLLALCDSWLAQRALLNEIAASHGVECSYAHGVECRGNTKLREKARAGVAAGTEKDNR